MNDNYYDILGVHTKASPNQIKKAYMALVTRDYFQSNKNERSNSQQLKKIQEAYEVLSDPEKRRVYDKKLNSEEEAAISSYSPAVNDTKATSNIKNQAGIDLDEKSSSSSDTESKKSVDAVLISFVVVIVVFFSIAIYMADQNTSSSNRHQKNNSLELIESGHDVNSLNEKVIATERVLLTRSLDGPATHYVENNTVLEVLRETSNYYRLLTDQGNFWAPKKHFKNFSQLDGKILYLVDSNFDANSPNKQVITTKDVRLKRELNADFTHYLEKNTIVEVLREGGKYYRLVTDQGKFWASKENFKTYSEPNEQSTSLTQSEEQKEEYIYEYGNILFDITGKNKPDIFSDDVREFKKGTEVLVVSKIKDTIYIKIRINRTNYYVMERSVSWE